MKHITMVLLVLFFYYNLKAQEDTIIVLKKVDIAEGIPIAKFGGRTGSSSISKEELITIEELIVVQDSTTSEKELIIISFDVTTIIQGFEMSLLVMGNKVSESQKNILRKVKPGENIYIENIKVKAADGVVMQLSKIHLKVL